MLGAWAVFVYVFLFAPIVLLVLFAFNANQYGTFPFTGWTTTGTGSVFNDYQIKDALETTLRVALEVTVIATVVGTAAAFPLVRARLRFRSGIRIGLTLPIMIPGLLIGVSCSCFFTDVLHMQLSPQTAVIGQAVYMTPFVILVVAARLEGFDPYLERAASDLGANTCQRLRYVVFPLIAPAIFAGALFAFTLSLDEFVITLFLIGGRQYAADLHLHASQVRHHARGQCDRFDADRSVDRAERNCIRASRRRLRRGRVAVRSRG